MTIRIITIASMVLLGFLAQVFVVSGVSAELVVNTTSSVHSSSSNSVTVTTGGTTVTTQDSSTTNNGTTEIHSVTTVNGEVVPESVVDIVETDGAGVSSHNSFVVQVDGEGNQQVTENEAHIEIIEEETVTDESGEPLIERSNVEITTEETTQEPSILARAWDAVVGFLRSLF